MRANVQGHRAEVLQGLVAHFDALDAQATRTAASAEDSESCGPVATQPSAAPSSSCLRTIEGTVILHFSFAVKQDQVCW